MKGGVIIHVVTYGLAYSILFINKRNGGVMSSILATLTASLNRLSHRPRLIIGIAGIAFVGVLITPATHGYDLVFVPVFGLCLWAWGLRLRRDVQG